MRRPHLLRVEAAPADFASLIEAARAAGIRAGWLELSEVEPPRRLESAAGLGVLRSVAVGGSRTLALKPLAGPPVLGDLLREHFLGCAVVLVLGEVAAPLLSPEASGSPPGSWCLRLEEGAEIRWTTGELVARLRSPRPLAEKPGSGC